MTRAAGEHPKARAVPEVTRSIPVGHRTWIAPALLSAALVACGAPTPRDASPPEGARAIRCEALPECDLRLGVCLRCVDDDDPRWVWSEAPGSPRALRVRADLLSDPQPDLDVSVGEPFSFLGPDCARFELDERGLPLRTIASPERDTYAWSYDAHGRVIEERVDRRPFCPIDDYGDEGPCGPPDGEWDEVITFEWRDLDDGACLVRWPGGERRFDSGGRLVRAVAPDGAVTEREHRDGRLERTTGPERTVEYEYDDAGRLLEMRARSAGASRVVRWERDPRGHVTRLFFDGAEVATYENTYEDGRLRGVRSTWMGRSPPVLETARAHEGGLLVRETIGVPGAAPIHESVWTRDERGVPLRRSTPDEDYRCLAPLAERFVNGG